MRPAAFWPVKIGRINVDMLREQRDQLWAEAVSLYHAGVPWWITKAETLKEAERHQRDRYIGDPWDKAIADFVETSTDVSIDEVLRLGLHLEIGRCGQSEMNRVARSLRALGYHRFQVRTGAKRVWKYRKPVTEEGETENVVPFKTVTTSSG